MSKNIIIFGDSYSTCEGCVPDGYPVYYSKNGSIEGSAMQILGKIPE